MATTSKRNAMTDLQKLKIAERKNAMFCKRKELALREREVKTDERRALVESINCLKALIGTKDDDSEYDDGYEEDINKKPMLPVLDEREMKRVKVKLMLLVDRITD